jgi:hypothetical protein
MGRRLSSFAGGQIWSELPDPRSELVPPDVRQRLATLGYVSQGLVGGPLERRSLRDAKDFIGQNWSPPQSPDVP